MESTEEPEKLLETTRELLDAFEIDLKRRQEEEEEAARKAAGSYSNAAEDLLRVVT